MPESEPRLIRGYLQVLAAQLPGPIVEELTDGLTGTASHAVGAGRPWPWVSSHHGSQAPPSPGTTTVNTTLRTTRLSDRVIVAPA